MLVTAGGLKNGSSNWEGVNEKFLFPVRALSKVFRAKCMDCFIKREVPLPVNRIMKKDWVVFCKAPIAKPDHLLLYLSRYIYRVAIDDSRIKRISVEDRTVTFSYKDYRKNGKIRLMTLDALEFIERFLQHVLPTGFVKVRYYGIFAHVLKKELLTAAKKSLKAQGQIIQDTLLSLETLLASIQIPEKPDICPRCHKADLIRHRILPVKKKWKPPPK